MSVKRNLLLLSNSTLHPTGYLEYAAEDICQFLRGRKVEEVLFVPYALRDQDGYTAKARSVFESWGFRLKSVHEAENPALAASNAQAIFIGGGNTFQLLNSLYENKLVDVIRKEQRIEQYHEIPGTPPVLALREGSILKVEGDNAMLIGKFHARLFVPGKETKEFPTGHNFSFLL
eukprot:GFUD01073374.1.p1 GENE.GFUD01073374.1~~GFUD01073374.1.p1  ORF type:complete len:175 (+),score=44.58 GFUD01073374.1:38-562(+)